MSIFADVLICFVKYGLRIIGVSPTNNKLYEKVYIVFDDDLCCVCIGTGNP